jgi:hypothetical protein
MFFLYAGFFLQMNGIITIPSVELSFKHKNRVEAHFLIKQAGFKGPEIYLGTSKTLSRNLDGDIKYIQKPLMGSGSRGVRLINSLEELSITPNDIIYLERYIQGTHFLIYFIGEYVHAYEKLPLTNEHAPVKKVDNIDDLQELAIHWKNKYNMLFGHLDVIREDKTNELIVVDPGTFPEFSNWDGEISPVEEIGKLIQLEYEKLKTK